MTRIIHGQKQSNSPPKKDTKIGVPRKGHKENQANSQTKTGQPLSPEECTLKTQPTHILKQDRPQSVSPEEHTLKPGQLTI